MVRPEELAQTLVSRHRARRLADEHRAAELLAASRHELEAAIRAGRITRAWLIGSLTTGLFGERSDVDVVVTGGQPSADAALWSELEHRLGVAVDLLRLESLPLPFRQRVLREGMVLHEPG